MRGYMYLVIYVSLWPLWPQLSHAYKAQKVLMIFQVFHAVYTALYPCKCIKNISKAIHQSGPMHNSEKARCCINDSKMSQQ